MAKFIVQDYDLTEFFGFLHRIRTQAGSLGSEDESVLLKLAEGNQVEYYTIIGNDPQAALERMISQIRNKKRVKQILFAPVCNPDRMDLSKLDMLFKTVADAFHSENTWINAYPEPTETHFTLHLVIAR